MVSAAAVLARVLIERTVYRSRASFKPLTFERTPSRVATVFFPRRRGPSSPTDTDHPPSVNSPGLRRRPQQRCRGTVAIARAAARKTGFIGRSMPAAHAYLRRLRDLFRVSLSRGSHHIIIRSQRRLSPRRTAGPCRRANGCSAWKVQHSHQIRPPACTTVPSDVDGRRPRRLRYPRLLGRCRLLIRRRNETTCIVLEPRPPDHDAWASPERCGWWRH